MRKKYMIKEIFSLAIAAESKARTLYTEFEMLFCHIPQARALWKQMADDEQLHENKLREMFETLTDEDKLSLKEDALITRAESFVRSIPIAEIIASTRTLDDAYETAYALEYSEVNAVMRFVLTELVAPEARRDFALSNIEEHVSRLEIFSKTICDEACRREIKAIRAEELEPR